MTMKPKSVAAFRWLTPILMGAALILGACAPAMTQQQIDAMVQESVALTVQAQNNMATAVAQTVEAMQPRATPTLVGLPTLGVPTLTPLATVTPLKLPSGGGGGGGGGGGKAKWACNVWTHSPRDLSEFSPGDPFDIKWVITNTGTETWQAGMDLDYYSGPHLTPDTGGELPTVKPGDSYTFSADANAPEEKGYYVMTYKLEGGFCWPYVAIYTGKAPQ